MESNKKVELRDALCDIRKAHRLICTFQQRMMDLALFIKSKLDMSTVKIHKHFSATIEDDMPLDSDMWAWDFLYSYQLEYEFSVKKYGEFQYVISLLQCVDTGFYDVEDNDKRCPDTFAPEECAESKLVFYVNKIPKNRDKWIQWDNRDKLFNNKKYMSKDFERDVIDYPEVKEKVLLYSFPIERFIDEQSTIEALQEFVDYCNKELDLNIRLI